MGEAARPCRLDRPATSRRRSCCGACRCSSTCMSWPSRTPSSRTSARSSSNTARRSSSWRAPRRSIDGRIAFGETHLFVGRGYVVSVRHGASTSYAGVRQRCEACPIVLANGEDYILYAILDFIVDNYMPVLETIHAEVEEIEDKVLRRGPRADRHRAPLHAPPRSPAPAQRRCCRWSRSAAGSSMPR